MASELVTPAHQGRKAIIYIRQSTAQQVISHQESLRLQYALRERALELGWPAEKIEVIDSDLGQTAATVQNRAGFKELVARVALGEVGIILSYEVTRLSRNCSDWYPLLDVCAYQKCLIADRDGVYDPALPNGRLLLGLKGQISELELHTIQLRLRAGLLNKAQRGELALPLPAGLVRQPDGRVVKDPDREVQARLELVFQSFLRLRSAGKTLRLFHQEGLRLPRRDRFGDLVWHKVTAKGILEILKNPAYAGAFVYGRTRTSRRADGKMVTRAVPQAEWTICLPGQYPAYIRWESYQQIQAMLQDNYTTYQENATRGVPRSGAAILAGIAYCGACGHKLVVHYKEQLSYVCNDWTSRRGEPGCQRFPGQVVDEAVVAAFLAALSPVELDVYAQALARQQAEESRLEQARQQQLQRLAYQAALAERQYQRVDPDNRLVAAELEQRWEESLVALRQAEEEMARRPAPPALLAALTPELRTALADIGRRLPALWSGGLLSQAQKKALLRCLVDKVVLHRPAREAVQVRIVWRGGDSTTSSVPIPVLSLAEMSTTDELTREIRTLAQEEMSDAEIAQQLTSRGFRSPRDPARLRPRTVAKIRRQLGLYRTHHCPRHLAGKLTLPQIAHHLGVSLHWLYYRIDRGLIQVDKDDQTGLYLFPDQPETLALFTAFKAGQQETISFSRPVNETAE